MVFCGQCGLHLPSGTTRCPRCGAVADATADANIDAFPTDAPTSASLPYAQRSQVGVYPEESHTSTPFTPYEPQKLVLRSGDYGNGVLENDEPTSEMNAPDYRTPRNFATNTPYISEASNVGYPVQTAHTYQNEGYTPGYTANVPPGGAMPTGYPSPAPIQQKRRRTLPLLLAILVLLLVLSGSTFFVVERLHLLGNTGSGNGGITTPASPIEQAKGLVQQYYDDINNKNYQDAYGLWKWGANAPSITAFENGYANTEHDALTITDATQQSDGTVKVSLTIVATERINGGTQQHTYTGYYIVGKDAGTWKILHGILNRTA